MVWMGVFVEIVKNVYPFTFDVQHPPKFQPIFYVAGVLILGSKKASFLHPAWGGDFLPSGLKKQFFCDRKIGERAQKMLKENWENSNFRLVNNSIWYLFTP